MLSGTLVRSLVFAIDMDCTNQDKELVNESNCMDEDVSSHDNCKNSDHMGKVVRNCVLTENRLFGFECLLI
jgi:hypothetical protein